MYIYASKACDGAGVTASTAVYTVETWTEHLGVHRCFVSVTYWHPRMTRNLAPEGRTDFAQRQRGM